MWCLNNDLLKGEIYILIPQSVISFKSQKGWDFKIIFYCTNTLSYITLGKTEWRTTWQKFN